MKIVEFNNGKFGIERRYGLFGMFKEYKSVETWKWHREKFKIMTWCTFRTRKDAQDCIDTMINRALLEKEIEMSIKNFKVKES